MTFYVFWSCLTRFLEHWRVSEHPRHPLDQPLGKDEGSVMMCETDFRQTVRIARMPRYQLHESLEAVVDRRL